MPEYNGWSRLARAGALLRRRRRVLLLAPLAGLLLAAALLPLLPRQLSATTTVLVAPAGVVTTGDPATTPVPVAMDTEARVAVSTPVAVAVRRALGASRSAEDLVEGTTATVPPGTTLLVLRHRADSARSAVRVANAFGLAYLSYREDQADRTLGEGVELLRQQAAEVRATARGLLARLRATPTGTARREVLEQQLELARRRAEQVDTEALSLLVASTDAGSVVDRATVGSVTTTGPGTGPVLLGGIVLGLLAGMVLAWWRDRHATVMEDREEDMAAHGLDLVGHLCAARLDDESVEDYRHLLHALRARLGPRATVLVTGVGDGGRGQRVAEALVRVTARSGVPTLLARSQPDAPGPEADESYWGVPNLRVERVYAGRLSTDAVIRRPELDSTIAGLGATSGDSLVVVTTPPTGKNLDAQAIAPHVSLALLVVEADQTRHADVREALHQLEQVGTPRVAGVAVSARVTALPDRGADRPRRRPVVLTVLVAATAVTAVLGVQSLRQAGPDDVADPDGDGRGSRGGTAVQRAVGPAVGGPGTTSTVAEVAVDGAVDVVERVVAAERLDEVVLAPPPRPPDGAGTPRLEDVRLRADGEAVPMPGPRAIVRRTVVRLPPGTRVLDLTYRVTGVEARSEPSPTGRATLSLRPAVRSLPGRLDAVIEVRGVEVLSVVCPSAPPAERLCGLDRPGGWRTVPVPSGRDRVVALVDLPAT